MEMGQDTYRDSAFAGFSLGVTMVTYPISLPTYLPACLPLAHKLHTLEAVLQVLHLNAPVLLLFGETRDTSYPVSQQSVKI